MIKDRHNKQRTQLLKFPNSCIVLAAIVLTFITACEPKPVEMSSGPPEGVFVVTTDYSTGSYSIIDPLNLKSYNDVGLYMIHSDAMVRYFSSMPDYVYIINRMGQDNIQALDRLNSYDTVFQESTGSSSNPHDICVVDNSRAYVTRYGGSRLWIINPATGKKTGDIDLSAFADATASGIPHMSRMYYHESTQRLFVAVQRLASDWHPSDYSSVLVIDANPSNPQYNTVIADIQLSWIEGSDTINATNPTTKFSYVPAAWWPAISDGHDHIFISCVGEYGHFFQLDCGIVAIDVTDMQCETGYVLSEAVANTEITEFIIKSGTEGYATTSDENFKSSLIKFNPQTGTITSTLRADNGEVGYLINLGLDSTGKLYLCDRNALDPGVRIYDTNSSDAPLNGNDPVYVGLPPFDLVFIE